MKAKPSRELLRLWGDVWEAWEIPATSEEGPLRFLGAAEEGAGAPENQIFSIPARYVVTVPLWVDSLDAAVVQESIELELEVRGLLPRKKMADAVCTRTLAVEGKTLVICAIFPVEVPAPYEKIAFARYEASPLLFEPTEDSVTLWREGADLVAAFARGGQVVYWATLDWPSDTKQVKQWLVSMQFSLQAAGILSARPRRVDLEAALQSDGLKDLIPEVPDQRAEILPSLKKADFRWKPEQARVIEKLSLARLKTRKVMVALASVYLALVVVAGGYLGWLAIKAEGLKREIAGLEVQTGEFQPLMREWRLIGAGTDTESFPLETLHRVVRNMPARGVRLTIYDVTDGRVTIEGEAESISMTSEFFAAISQDQELVRMSWQMPTPELLPNNAARFQLTGLMP